MLNPEAHYRFLIRREDGYDWLTGAGVFDHDVPDAFDFRLSTHAMPPDWGRDGAVYQIFPDRFARSAAADERPVAGLGGAGRVGRRRRLRGLGPAHAHCSSSAATWTGSPTISTTSPRSAPTSST